MHNLLPKLTGYSLRLDLYFQNFPGPFSGPNIAPYTYKVVLESRVSPAFMITYFCNHCNIRFENIKVCGYTDPFFQKPWTKGHWPLDDLWPHVCWSYMCDSTQGWLCPSPMTIHQCMWIQWSILQNDTTYIHILLLRTYYILRTYYVQNEWSHSLLLNSVQARPKMPPLAHPQTRLAFV